MYRLLKHSSTNLLIKIVLFFSKVVPSFLWVLHSLIPCLDLGILSKWAPGPYALVSGYSVMDGSGMTRTSVSFTLLFTLGPSTLQSSLGGGGAPGPTLSLMVGSLKLFSRFVPGIPTLQPFAPVSVKGMTLSYLVPAVRTVQSCMCAVASCGVHQLQAKVAVPQSCIHSNG